MHPSMRSIGCSGQCQRRGPNQHDHMGITAQHVDDIAQSPVDGSVACGYGHVPQAATRRLPAVSERFAAQRVEQAPSHVSYQRVHPRDACDSRHLQADLRVRRARCHYSAVWRITRRSNRIDASSGGWASQGWDDERILTHVGHNICEKCMLPKRRFGNVEKDVGNAFCKHFSSLLAQIEYLGADPKSPIVLIRAGNVV